MNPSATLARSITWKSSKQSCLTALFLADQNLSDDCLRAYAYFRWVDDAVDLSSGSLSERSAFLSRQKALIDDLYHDRHTADLCPEEVMLADMVAHDRGSNSGLRSFIYNFMAVIEFDNGRKGRLVGERELGVYTTHLASAVMDGLQYFIGNEYPYPNTAERILAVTGAHIVHMLRDTVEDLQAGIVNIPREAIQAEGLSLDDLGSPAFRNWVRGQVEKARVCFQAGRRYINTLAVLRCKLAGTLYIARFECILDAIQREDYLLRAEYPERHCLSSWLKMLDLALGVVWQHIYTKLRIVNREEFAESSTEPRLNI